MDTDRAIDRFLESQAFSEASRRAYRRDLDEFAAWLRRRGLDLESGGVRARLRKYVPVLVPIFMTSLRGADRMAIALEARGFRAGPRRTSYRRYAFAARDAVAAVLIGGALVVFSWLKARGLAGVAL